MKIHYVKKGDLINVYSIKKFFIKELAMILVFMLTFPVAFAEDNVDESYITRFEFVKTLIMKIGCTEKIINNLSHVSYSNSAFVDIKNSNQMPYIRIAKSAGILYGEPIDSNKYFLNASPDRNITIKEAIVMLGRCFMDDKTTDMNEAILKAKDKDILLQEDEFFANIDMPVSKDIYDILLERFLNNYIYKKIEEVNIGDSHYVDYKISIYTDSIKTYRDLEKEKTK